jgi:hypothetical protein
MRAPSGRRRGGQPGNHNRLKHGLYARQLSITHTLRLERLGLNRNELGIALARARIKMLLTKQAAASPREFLTYERAIKHYLDLIARLIQRNSDLRLETGIPSHQLHELVELLKDLDDE